MSTPQLNNSNVRIRVTTEVLTAKADEVLKDINVIQQNLEIIDQKLKGTKGYWLGEAGELNRKLYTDQVEAIKDMMKRLKEHPTKLKAISGAYTQTEGQVTALAKGLDENILL